MAKLNYTEEIEVQGIRIPFVPEIITPRIERQMRKGNYEIGECNAARKWVQACDRVLDLGAGIGLVSSTIASISGVGKVVSIEANRELVEMIEETHRINGIDNVELRNGIVAKEAAEDAYFYLREHFWSSSMEPDSRPYREKVLMPAYAISDLIEELRPTVIASDIEGGEIEVFEDIDLSGVRTVIIEVHPLVYGQEGQRKVLKYFDDHGFRAEKEYLAGSVWIFNRHPKEEVPRIFTRGPTSPEHNLTNPRIVIPTCMRNEGPYLLEWIAYHKSIGVTEFIVFTNDCTDGTDLMLDRLQEMGIVTHLPNPASAAGSHFFQPVAMKFSMMMRQVRDADYVIQIDVDEFINSKIGSGHLHELFAETGPFHVLSISELNFSSSGQWAISDVWMTETFREHETPTPGHWQARRGVKSIIHGVDNFEHWPVHRPGVFAGTHDQFIWLDGSGQQVPEDFIVNHENGIDRRGRYDLVQLDHHPLRSAEAFMMKQVRGKVSNNRRTIDYHYYRRRALGGKVDGVIDPKIKNARKEWDKLVADTSLSELHKHALEHHRHMITQIDNNPEISELRDWLAKNYFPERS